MTATEWTKQLHSKAVELREAIRLWLPDAGQPNIYPKGAISGVSPYLKVGLAVSLLETQLATPVDLLELDRDTMGFVHQARVILKEVKDHLIFDLNFSGSAIFDPVDVIEDATGTIVGLEAPANWSWRPGRVSEVDLACRLQLDKAIELLEKSGQTGVQNAVAEVRTVVEQRAKGTRQGRPRKKIKSVQNQMIVHAVLVAGHNLFQDTPPRLDPFELNEIVGLCQGKLSTTQVSRAIRALFGSHREYAQKLRGAGNVEVVEGIFNAMSDGPSSIDGVAG